MSVQITAALGAEVTLPLAKTGQRARAQGLNSTLVYLANVAAAFAAGGLLHWQGWAVVNLACLPLLAAAGGLLLRMRRAG